jgi:hypothetical protein
MVDKAITFSTTFSTEAEVGKIVVIIAIIQERLEAVQNTIGRHGPKITQESFKNKVRTKVA